MEGYPQPSDKSLSDSVSTLDLGPPLIASDLSLDYGDSSALNTVIEMGPSPVDSPATQAWDDSDWNTMQEPSETDEADFDSESDPLPNINIESESELASSPEGSIVIDDLLENYYQTVEWEPGWPSYSWDPPVDVQWEVISSGGYDALSSAVAMPPEDESWIETTGITPFSPRPWFTNRRARQPILREVRRGHGHHEPHTRDNSSGNNYELSDASS